MQDPATWQPNGLPAPTYQSGTDPSTFNPGNPHVAPPAPVPPPPGVKWTTDNSSVFTGVFEKMREQRATDADIYNPRSRNAVPEVQNVRHHDPRIQEAQQHAYRQGMETYIYQPVVNDLIDELNNLDYVGEAEEQVNRTAAGLAGRTERMHSRYGLNVTPAMMNHQRGLQARNQQLAMTQAKNNARLNEYSAEQRLRSQIVGYGDTTLAQAEGLAVNNAGMAAAQDQAAYAHKQQQNQQIAAGVGTALTIAALVIR